MHSDDAVQHGLLQNRRVQAPPHISMTQQPGGKSSLQWQALFWRLVPWLGLMVLLAAITLPTQQAHAAPVLALSADTQHANLQPPLEFLLDPAGKLGIEDIDTQPGLQFAPAPAGKRYFTGYGALWLRFDAVVHNEGAHWRLTVPLPGVDDVALYYRDSDGRWVTQVAGDTRPMSTWAQPARYPVFTLAPGSGQPVRYYVEVRHPRIPFSAMPQVMSDVQLVNASQTEHMLLGVYFGLAALVVVLALINAASFRDAGFGTYALYIALFAAAQASFTGVAGLYWWPEWTWASRATILLLPVSAASAMLFVRTVTGPQRYARLADRALLTLIVVVPLAGLVDAVMPTEAGYAVMNGLIATSLAVVFTTIGLGLKAGDKHTRWVFAGFLPVLLCTLFPLLRNLNVIASGVLSDYALLFGSAIEVPILFYGLHRRVAQRRELLARTSGLGEHDPLTGLDSSKAFLGKMGQSLATAGRYQLPFAVLVIHIANHDALEKQHGREAADRAIVMAASRIRGVAHSTDALARVAHTQFALLMEGPIDAFSANDVATKILTSGLRPSAQLPDAETLQFHIAVGHVDGKSAMAPEEAAACLARLQQAVRAMNDGSRKAIRAVKL